MKKISRKLELPPPGCTPPLKLQFPFMSDQTRIMYVSTDRALGYMVQRQSPEAQYQQSE